MNIKSLTDNFDNNIGIITLVTGHIEDGKPYYAYAIIPPSKYLAFKEAEKHGDYDLADYGEIIAHGHGAEPSAEVKKEIEEKYGANHEFEDELKSIIEN